MDKNKELMSSPICMTLDFHIYREIVNIALLNHFPIANNVNARLAQQHTFSEKSY